MSAANNLLSNFAVYVDGLGYAGNAEKVTPPALVVKIEDFTAGGLDSSIPIDMGTEKMELKFTLSDLAADALGTWGVIGGADFVYNLKGALKNLDGSISSMLISCRGRTRSITDSDWQSGQKATNEYLVDCTYYLKQVDGNNVIEIDVPNMIRNINGVDQLANIRAALGM